MNAWIIKTETYDPKLALEIVADQRTKGYSACIEDEHGKAVDEEAFRMNQTKPTKTTLREKGMGLGVFFGIRNGCPRYSLCGRFVACGPGRLGVMGSAGATNNAFFGAKGVVLIGS